MLIRHNPFGLVLLALNKVHRCIVFILDNIYILNYTNINKYTVFAVKFLVITRFWQKGFIEIFLHNSFHVGVIKITPKKILHTILDVHPQINFMNKQL